MLFFFFFFFQAEDGIRDKLVTGVQTCALPISGPSGATSAAAWPRGGPARTPTPTACSYPAPSCANGSRRAVRSRRSSAGPRFWKSCRSEEHTSELQSLAYLVCRLLLEKKKIKIILI